MEKPLISVSGFFSFEEMLLDYWRICFKIHEAKFEKFYTYDEANNT